MDFYSKLLNEDDFNNPEQLNKVNEFVTGELNQINIKIYNFKFSEMDVKQAIKSLKTNTVRPRFCVVSGKDQKKYTKSKVHNFENFNFVYFSYKIEIIRF